MKILVIIFLLVCFKSEAVQITSFFETNVLMGTGITVTNFGMHKELENGKGFHVQVRFYWQMKKKEYPPRIWEIGLDDTIPAHTIPITFGMRMKPPKGFQLMKLDDYLALLETKQDSIADFRRRMKIIDAWEKENKEL